MFWTEEVEKCVKRYMGVFESVFHKFMGKKNIVKRCWKLADFVHFCEDFEEFSAL